MNSEYSISIGSLVLSLLGVLFVIFVIARRAGRSDRANARGPSSALVAAIGAAILAILVFAAIALVMPGRAIPIHAEATTSAPSGSRHVAAEINDERTIAETSTSPTVQTDSDREDDDANSSTFESRGTIANLFLAGVSLCALLAFARVAADGRRRGGYGVLARSLAVIAFAGLCALLWTLGPILK